jgi:hypothetical protein
MSALRHKCPMRSTKTAPSKRTPGATTPWHVTCTVSGFSIHRCGKELAVNKRIQKKVAKRNGGTVRQHNVATPSPKQAKSAASKARGGERKAGSHKPESSLKPGDVAIALVEGAREVAAGAVAKLGAKLAKREKRAEKLIAKVPGVGPTVAKKLHDLAGSD